MEFEIVYLPNGKPPKLESRNGIFKIAIQTLPDGKKRGTATLLDENGVELQVSITGEQYTRLNAVQAQCPVGVKTPAVRLVDGKVEFGLTNI